MTDRRDFIARTFAALALAPFASFPLTLCDKSDPTVPRKCDTREAWLPEYERLSVQRHGVELRMRATAYDLDAQTVTVVREGEGWDYPDHLETLHGGVVVRWLPTEG